MKRYRVWVSWTETGYYYVDADSEKEAEEIAYDLPNLPHEREDILEDSFRVDSIDR